MATAPLPHPAAQTCPQCGAALDGKMQSCPYCGTVIQLTSAQKSTPLRAGLTLGAQAILVVLALFMGICGLFLIQEGSGNGVIRAEAWLTWLGVGIIIFAIFCIWGAVRWRRR